MGLTWGWLQAMVLRPQRSLAGYVACALATLLACLETLVFFGASGAAAFVATAFAGAFAHGYWVKQIAWRARQ